MRVIGNAVRFPPISSTGRRRRNRSEIRFQPNCLLVVVASLSVYSSFSLAFCFLPCTRSESIFPAIVLPPPTPAGRPVVSEQTRPGFLVAAGRPLFCDGEKSPRSSARESSRRSQAEVSASAASPRATTPVRWPGTRPKWCGSSHIFIVCLESSTQDGDRECLSIDRG
jgi:hypothetical protein